MRHRPTKGAATDMFDLQPPRHISTLRRPATTPPQVQLLVAEHYNHFELPETLGNPYGLLGRAALDLMGLTAGVCR